MNRPLLLQQLQLQQSAPCCLEAPTEPRPRPPTPPRVLSAVIMFNKYLLAYAGFPFPVLLTMWHMFFCSTLAYLLVRSGRVQSVNMDRETYLKAIVPIGACYAGTLWVGNAAYLYLSVSFIQMLKALMPVAVFSVGGQAGGGAGACVIGCSCDNGGPLPAWLRLQCCCCQLLWLAVGAALHCQLGLWQRQFGLPPSPHVPAPASLLAPPHPAGGLRVWHRAVQVAHLCQHDVRDHRRGHRVLRWVHGAGGWCCRRAGPLSAPETHRGPVPCEPPPPRPLYSSRYSPAAPTLPPGPSTYPQPRLQLSNLPPCHSHATSRPPPPPHHHRQEFALKLVSVRCLLSSLSTLTGDQPCASPPQPSQARSTST